MLLNINYYEEILQKNIEQINMKKNKDEQVANSIQFVYITSVKTKNRI